MKKLITIFLLMLFPINFGFTDNFSEEFSFDYSTEFMQDIENYEISDLIVYNTETVPIYFYNDVVEFYKSTEYHMKTHYNSVDFNYNKYNYIYDRPVYANNYNIDHFKYYLIEDCGYSYYEMNKLNALNYYTNKKGKFSPFFSQFMWLNTKENKRISFYYTSGFF